MNGFKPLRRRVIDYTMAGQWQEVYDGSIYRLAAENAKLQEQRARLFDKTLELGTENAKLRELVEDMLDCIEIRMAFGRPPTYEMYEGFAQRAGELGIEVDALEVDG